MKKWVIYDPRECEIIKQVHSTLPPVIEKIHSILCVPEEYIITSDESLVSLLMKFSKPQEIDNIELEWEKL